MERQVTPTRAAATPGGAAAATSSRTTRSFAACRRGVNMATPGVPSEKREKLTERVNIRAREGAEGCHPVERVETVVFGRAAEAPVARRAACGPRRRERRDMAEYSGDGLTDLRASSAAGRRPPEKGAGPRRLGARLAAQRLARRPATDAASAGTVVRRHPAVYRGDDVRAAGLQASGGAIRRPRRSLRCASAGRSRSSSGAACASSAHGHDRRTVQSGANRPGVVILVGATGDADVR